MQQLERRTIERGARKEPQRSRDEPEAASNPAQAVMVMNPPHETLSERLEAAAISLKMIAANNPDASSFIATLAVRFAVDEQALQHAAQSPALQQTYDRIHLEKRPMPAPGLS